MGRASARFSQPSYSDLGTDQALEPLWPAHTDPPLESWHRRREVLRKDWEDALGVSSYDPFDPGEELVDAYELPDWSARVFRQPTSPTTRQLVLVMIPRRMVRSPCAAVVIPFYHPDSMAGYDLEHKQPILDSPITQFGRHLVEQGYAVACAEAFPFNTVPAPQNDGSFAWWQAASEKLLRENPKWTGMGKLVWDTRLATDLLLKQPEVDPSRLAIMGHSLGGKMAFYAACLDDRIRAAIASDFGFGYSFSNWDAPWYLGSKLRDPAFHLQHHHLLALCAPRAFFLIAGDCDGPASWQYILAAQSVYRLYGREEAVGCFDHGTGHPPTEESLAWAYRWLGEQMDLPPVDWALHDIVGDGP